MCAPVRDWTLLLAADEPEISLPMLLRFFVEAHTRYTTPKSLDSDSEPGELEESRVLALQKGKNGATGVRASSYSIILGVTRCIAGLTDSY